ncbi:MAG: DUF2282 domain-containing protein [Pseudomonadota bacterium]|nr:DUF2282 domain-containing protein [Pseudomonadota bacterium]
MHDRFIATSLAAVLALAAATAAQAADTGREKEKCYGVAKPGTNDCANLSGSHSCAGQTRNEKALEDFNYVPKGTCAKMGGKSEEEARADIAKR